MDTELDDFANDKQMQEQRRAQREYDLMIKECIDIASKELSLEQASCADIQSFLLFQAFQSPAIGETFRSTSANLPIEVYQVQFHWSSKVGRTTRSGYDECLLGLLTLNKSTLLPVFMKNHCEQELLTGSQSRMLTLKIKRNFLIHFV